MKRFVYRGFVIGCILTFLVVFIPPISGFLSDVVSQSFTVSASKIQIEVTDFKVHLDTKDYPLDANGEFESTLIQNEVMDIEFTLNNLSPFDVDVEGTFELSFVNEAQETQIVTLYTGETSDASIKAGELNGLIIGEQTLDTQELSATSQNRTGISKQVLTNTLTTKEGNGEGFKSKTYAYKLYLSDSVVAAPTLIQILRNNKLGIGINVNATGTNNQSKWSSSVSTYGDIKTDLMLERNLTFSLNGDDPLYVVQNTQYQEPGWIAYNEYNENVKVETSGELDMSTYGTYTLMYTAQFYDEPQSLTRTVIVTDGEKPVINPLNEKAEKFVSQSLELKNLVEVTDNVEDPGLKDKLEVITPDNFDSMKTGVNTICYNLTDNSGLSAEQKCIELTLFAYKEVAPMFDTTLALTTHGRVYSWGKYNQGETGRDKTPDVTHSAIDPFPGEITALRDHNIVQIDGGSYFGMALSSEGKLFIWGSDDYGVQGNGSKITSFNRKPIPVENVGTVQQISCGEAIATILNTDGVVYSWGNSQSFATGTGKSGNVVEPTRVKIPEDEKIIYISQGKYNGFAISESGKLYGWGSDTYKQLLGKGGSNAANPVRDLTETLSLFFDVSDIKEISLVNYGVLVLTKSGDVYVWGSNGSSKLGIDKGSSFDKPTLNETFKLSDIKVEKIRGGWSYGTALDDKGNIYVWGENAFGSLATFNSRIPMKIEMDSLKFTSMGAYYATTGLITTEGYLYMSGSNDYGELGIGKAPGDSYKFVMTLYPQ